MLQSLKPEVGWEAEYVLPSSGETIVAHRFWRSDTTLLDMPEQSTRISGGYVRNVFSFDFVSTMVCFLKLTPIFLIRGPQWIHTSRNNPILNIAINSDTPLHSWNERINLYNQSGLMVDHAKANALWNVQWKIIEEALRHNVQNRVSIPESESLYDYFVSRAAGLLPDLEDQGLLLAMSEMWGNYTGVPIQRQSLRFAWMEECCAGGMEAHLQ